MEQIGVSEIRELALKNKYNTDWETQLCQSAWIREHSHIIAQVESKRASRTYDGEFPRGWRHQMIKDCKKQAEDAVIAKFIGEYCRLIDGVYWLICTHKMADLKNLRNNKKASHA